MFCPHCGTAASEQARYCKGCGMSLGGAATQPETQERTPQGTQSPWAAPTMPVGAAQPLYQPPTPPSATLDPLAAAVNSSGRFDDASEPGWTMSFITLCGVVAVLIGAVVGYLVVQLVVAR